MAVQKIGNIEVRTEKDMSFKNNAYGVEAVIINPVTGQGWGLPLEDVSPRDLRDLAEFIEKRGCHKEKIISYCEEQGLNVYITTTRYQDMTTHEKLDFGFKDSHKNFLDDEKHPLTKKQIEELIRVNCVSIHGLGCIKTYSLGY